MTIRLMMSNRMGHPPPPPKQRRQNVNIEIIVDPEAQAQLMQPPSHAHQTLCSLMPVIEHVPPISSGFASEIKSRKIYSKLARPYLNQANDLVDLSLLSDARGPLNHLARLLIC